MHLDDLEAFVSVIDNGSIVAAASRLNLTQSAVTRRIQNLESSLGTELLNRTTRPISATELGGQTYKFARGMMSSIEDLKSSIIHKGQPSGEFRFGVCSGLGEQSLLEPIEVLGRLYPKLQLRAASRWTSILLDRLRSGELDAAVVLLAEEVAPPAGLDGECIGVEQLVVLVSKSFKLPKTVTLEDLKPYMWILDADGCNRRDALKKALEKKNIPFQMLVETDGAALQLSLIDQGRGIGLTINRAFAASPLRSRLRMVKVEDFAPKLQIWILHTEQVGRLAKPIETLKDMITHGMRSPSPSPKREVGA
jgi:DNA-binding transcriptional LysR family regulator